MKYNERKKKRKRENKQTQNRRDKNFHVFKRDRVDFMFSTKLQQLELPTIFRLSPLRVFNIVAHLDSKNTSETRTATKSPLMRDYSTIPSECVCDKRIAYKARRKKKKKREREREKTGTKEETKGQRDGESDFQGRFKFLKLASKISQSLL